MPLFDDVKYITCWRCGRMLSTRGIAAYCRDCRVYTKVRT